MDTSILILVFGILFVCSGIQCRSTAEMGLENTENDEAHTLQHVEVHVLTKRSTLNDIQQDYPKIYGHTHKASEPLDPSKQKSNVEGPLSIFEGFDTVNTIYEPVVEEGDPKNAETQTERRYTNPQEYTAFERSAAEQAERSEDRRDDDVTDDGDDKDDASKKLQNGVGTPTYGAQRPYPLTSSTEEEYRRSQTYPSGTRYGDSGVERQVTSYRTVISGGPTYGDDDRRRQTQTRFEAYRTADEFTPSENTRTYQTGQTRTQYVPTDRTQYGTRTYTQTGSRYPSGGEVRGAPYNGPRYVDNNGHYIDAQGRHLDSTGRYYDISGRYTDATVTHTVTYPSSGSSSGSSYVPTSGGSQSRFYATGGSGGDVSSGPGRYVDGGDSRPVTSYGGTQFYSSGSSFQNTYSPLTSQISSDPNCPVTNTRVTINGLTCRDAVGQLGNFVCYNYERVSEECCRQCLQVKRSENVGCEYGDRSTQCRTIQPHDCYNARNREICCERCDQFRRQMASIATPGCEYLDQSPRCQSVRERPYLCYHPENNRTCCSSCPRLARDNRHNCPWGDQNPLLCEPFDASHRLQINCYEPLLQSQCCSTCTSLRERMRDNIPGCEYGDYPILFTNGRQQFTCAEYIRHYHNEDHCAIPDFARKCCYTCFRYRQARG